jgi:CDP-paratose 2-epimerase
MEDARLMEQDGRYQFADLANGITEQAPLDFHSPYGCSKGAADQYVRDYARIYGMKTVVFRQSCIYGYRQFGVEDQGWVAWFTIASVMDRPITIYGDGKQVRDLLFITDLVNAFQIALDRVDEAGGHVYNIGGGAANQASLLQVIRALEELSGRKIALTFDDWRPGDQKVCVMDIAKAKDELGWQPRVGVQEGVEKLYRWVIENKSIFLDDRILRR